MKPAHLAALGLSIVIGGVLSYSQQSPIPLRQIQRDAQLSAMRTPSHSEFAGVSLPEPAPGFSSSASLSLPSPAAMASSSAGIMRPPVFRSPRVLDARYLWFNGLDLALALSDIEMTQHCINEHTCREANPLMPSSQAGKIAVSLGFVGYSGVGSYWFKKHNSKAWWLPPTVAIAAHGLGLASGLAHR